MAFTVIEDGEVLSEHTSLDEALDALEELVSTGDFKYAAMSEGQGDLLVFHVMLEKWNATQIANLNAEVLYTPGDNIREFLTTHMEVTA